MPHLAVASILLCVAASAVLADAAATNGTSCGCPTLSGAAMSEASRTGRPIPPRQPPPAASPEIEDKDVIRMGDMLIPREDIERAASPGSGSRLSTAPSDYINCLRPWPNGVLRYRFSTSYPNSSKSAIRAALATLQSRTGNLITFVEAESFMNEAHVTVVNDKGCWSYVGKMYAYASQNLYLAVPECINEHTIQHEFIHALGFYHEQSRSDRDSYVDILWDNIQSDQCGNFWKSSFLIPNDFPGYDYNSIMHYASFIFACNSSAPALRMKNGSTIDYFTTLTDTDVSKLRYVYSTSNLQFCMTTTTASPRSSSCGCSSQTKEKTMFLPRSSSSSSGGGGKSSRSSSSGDAIRIDDMLIPKQDLEVALAADGSVAGFRYSIQSSQYINCRRLWPQGKLYYRFETFYPTSYKSLIRQSLARLESETNNLVTFDEVGYFYSGAHVTIVDEDGCWSYVGKAYSASSQELSLAVPSCMLESIIQHEFLHALGFDHEQCRSDRDSYVSIQWSNIDNDACSNFQKNSYQIPSDFPSYDYGSVMHYTSSAFACGTGLSTIVKTGGGTVSVRNSLSSLDVSKLKYMYSEGNLEYCSGSQLMGSWTQITSCVLIIVGFVSLSWPAT